MVLILVTRVFSVSLLLQENIIKTLVLRKRNVKTCYTFVQLCKLFNMCVPLE